MQGAGCEGRSAPRCIADPPPPRPRAQTASLVAASCRSSAVFSGMTPEVKEAMYDYGKHLGLAFQVRRRGGTCKRRPAGVQRASTPDRGAAPYHMPVLPPCSSLSRWWMTSWTSRRRASSWASRRARTSPAAT